MLITSVVLPSPDPGRLVSFYSEVLGLPTAGSVVTAGHSTIRVVDGPTAPGSHHLAFSVPLGKVPATRTWLANRAELLVRDGRDLFTFDPPFGPAESLYFADPDGSVLELIGRDGPSPAAGSGFDPIVDITGVAEVAIPVAAVPEAVDLLTTLWSLPPVLASPEFAAVGDRAGMFILVRPERPWFPTADRLPNLTPLAIDVDTGHSGGPRTLIFANQTTATATASVTERADQGRTTPLDGPRD
jgi:catechol 2,3-dioxygenase-like lactoylglutathione lyase family enzyme